MPKEPKPIETPKPIAVTQLEFLQKVAKEGYGLADVVGKVVIIDREEKDILSLGFQDLNGRKQIVLSSTMDKWKRIFEDGLAYIEENTKEK